MSARTTQTPAVSRSKQTYGSMVRFSAVCAIAAACVAVVVSALAFVPLLQPEWRVPGWHWIAFSLTVVAAGVFALPVHAAAVRRLSRSLKIGRAACRETAETEWRRRATQPQEADA